MNDFRCVGRTQNIAEAEQLASEYKLQEFETKIVKKSRGTLAIYEI